MSNWIKGLHDSFKKQSSLNIQDAALSKQQNNITKRDAAQFQPPNNP